MDARSIIAKQRDKHPLTGAELEWFAAGLANGRVSDAQAGAFAMAVVLNGLDTQARAGLTLAMRDSGDVMRWDLPGPVVDKHSTGGLGDSTSLILAPALAVCGAYVPMISGRGLGHTGGTLDKLEAMPGFDTRVDAQTFQTLTKDLGCAIVSAGENMAPADRRLYAIRDISGTVESIDLITASILSKKLAAGLEVLVLDVKCGSGAFMKTRKDALALAQSLVDTSNAAGCRTSALITDMYQPLARAMGNAIEIQEVLEVLKGEKTGRLLDLSIELGAQALLSAGRVDEIAEGCKLISDSITSGAAAERFAQMTSALGAKDPLNTGALPKAPVQLPVMAQCSGIVSAMDGQRLGLSVIALGGGRQVETDTIDPSVGVNNMVTLGQAVSEGEPLCVIHARTEDDAQRVALEISDAISISPEPAEVPDLVLEMIG